jgi:hypothetical protein
MLYDVQRSGIQRCIVSISAIFGRKKKGYRKVSFLFSGMDMGFEESGTPEGGAKKCPVDTFLARGENP